MPIYELLGGSVRDTVEVYAWIGRERDSSDAPAAIAEHALAKVAEGYTALKLTTPPLGLMATPHDQRRVVRQAMSVREAVGDKVKVAIDCHGRYTPAMAARLLAEVEPMTPHFVEEPVLPEHSAALGPLVARTSVPIATGERLMSHADFLAPLEAGVAVVQPDVGNVSLLERERSPPSRTFGGPR